MSHGFGTLELLTVGVVDQPAEDAGVLAVVADEALEWLGVLARDQPLLTEPLVHGDRRVLERLCRSQQQQIVDLAGRTICHHRCLSGAPRCCVSAPIAARRDEGTERRHAAGAAASAG
ncbi:MAG: hypothetical protein WKF58_12925 [Ilumatobacteraceae bacterium]